MNTTQIIKYLDQCSLAYYSGHPLISDQQFDKLSELVEYSTLGAAVTGNTAKHYFPMYSLQKHYVDEGAQPLLGYGELSCTPKLDGAAISLLYVDGALVLALTRGDGIQGQNITDKFLATSLVPHYIDHQTTLQVTGEIVAPNYIENARNYAAGSLNLKSIDEFKTRAVNFFAYGVNPLCNNTYDQDLKMLSRLGFSTVSEPNLDKVYPCDGVVFRVNSNHKFHELGYTSKHPRGAFAQKERAQHVETTITGVEWQVGKSGKVTPVALLEPVLIGDALVSRATLNNPKFIETLGIKIGDRVAVARAGEIIPCILHKVEA